ncbi:MAG: uroporphyrinogen-III C-methyltransferase [Gammaproteobacteria bacterium]
MQDIDGHDTQTLPQQPRKKCRWAAVFLTINLLLIIALAALGYFYYQQLTQHIQQQTQLQKAQLVRLQNAALTNMAALKQQQQLLNGARQQLNQLNIETQRKTGDWLLAEADYLVKLANINLTFDRNTTLAKQLLTSADQRIANLGDAHLLTVRTALASDISKLTAVPSVDTPGLVAQLNGLQSQLEQLPITAQLATAKTTTATPTATAPNAISWSEKVKAFIAGVGHSLEDIVVIHHDTPQSAPLLPPDQYAFVITNIDMQLGMAQWAVLHQQPAIYTQSLNHAAEWIQRYFDTQQVSVRKIVDQIKDLQAVNIKPDIPDISQSITAIQKAMESAKP